MRCHIRLSNDEKSRGQSLVELALMFPVLMFILVGALDLGRVYYTDVAITNAARMGARAAAGDTTMTDDQIKDAALAEIANVGLTVDRSNITVTPEKASRVSGATVVVRVNVTFNMIFGQIFGWNTIPLTATATMVII